MRLPKALLVLSLLQLGLAKNELEELSQVESTAPLREDASASQVYKQALSVLSALAASETAASYTATASARGPITAALRWIKQRSKWRSKSYRRGSDHFAGISGDEGQALKVVDLLEHAIELGSVDALYTLGQISLFPPSRHLQIDAPRAFKAYTQHAALTGNSTSQFYTGFFHATGYGNATLIDQKRALLDWTFSAHGEKGDGNGNKRAQMALGYRYWTGVGVNEGCLTALDWYEAAADKSMEKFLSGPIGGRLTPLPLLKLSDMDGGAYGFGSSSASTSLLASRAVIKALISRQAGETVEDLIEYFQYNADRNNLYSIYRLGRIYYQGSIYPANGGIASGSEGVSLVARDLQLAKKYFFKLVREIWVKDTPAQPLSGRRNPKPKSKNGSKDSREEGDKEKEIYAGHAAGYLGRMYLRGEGFKKDLKMARMWFERGAEYQDREALNGLGILWRDGLVDGHKSDYAKAIEYFKMASAQELAEAQVNLGKYYYGHEDLVQASQYFDVAVRNGSPFEAYYYIAEMHAMNARGRLSRSGTTQLAMTPSGSCAVATSFFKVVAERGSWGDELVREGNNLWDGGEKSMGMGNPTLALAGTERGKQEALLRWLIAAEIGIEAAQNNVAYVLDQDKSSLRSPDFAQLAQLASKTHEPRAILKEKFPMNSSRVALTYWTRSAAQRNVDALVKVGDYHYYGIGFEGENTPEDVHARYERAAGYYQSAVETQISALAMWNMGWMYENGVGVPQDFHLAKRFYDMALETNTEAYLPVVLSLIKLHLRSIWHALSGGSQREKLLIWGDEPEGDSGWYLGKSKADMKKKQRDRDVGEAGREGEEMDLTEWKRRRRDEEDQGDFGPEDYFEAATRRWDRGEGDDDDDDLETLLLFGLFIAIAGLMYWRNRWVDRRQQQDQAPNAQQQQQRQPQEQRNNEAALVFGIF